MEPCIRHPDRETPYRCMKHEVYMCEECLHCRDPEIYCKFRPSCAIHFMEKHGDLPRFSAPEIQKAGNQPQGESQNSADPPAAANRESAP